MISVNFASIDQTRQSSHLAPNLQPANRNALNWTQRSELPPKESEKTVKRSCKTKGAQLTAEKKHQHNCQKDTPYEAEQTCRRIIIISHTRLLRTANSFSIPFQAFFENFKWIFTRSWISGRLLDQTQITSSAEIFPFILRAVPGELWSLKQTSLVLHFLHEGGCSRYKYEKTWVFNVLWVIP
jgi:hypothetical protein